MTPKPSDFEKLGAFYLGRVRDVEESTTTSELVLLDSRDLTTHAVCVGMTGSGKTGLCIGLLEEAALDGVPAIAIDPKGDLANLMLTFPGLSGEEFLPWIDETEAAREGRSPGEQADAIARRWKDGLASWGQDGERIARLRAAAEFVVYTPGSSAARPIAVLRSFAAPPAEILEDPDALRERVSSTASGLLALAGIDSDPLRGREHVLLATILEGAWREGRSLDLATLIGEVRKPRFQTMGVVDLESFHPEKDRFEFAMNLNALAASPGFAAWMEGEPLDVASMLRAPDGRPRISIVSIAHLSDPERMFFVTLLLQEIVGWMRRQPGTASLRALLFMDEVFGFLPPTANPPSKLPMLTLLKQARAHGLGVVLATQNPVDLDYKALSNTGTWMLGRLQTERDKLRVLDGLEGAAASGGKALDRKQMDALLSGLGKRMFVLGSAHEDVPIVFESRWAMSYLRGPLTRSQLTKLAKPVTAASDASAPTAASAAPDPMPVPTPAAASAGDRPLLPPGVPEIFLAPAGVPSGAEITYRLRLLARARLHHVSAKEGVDAWSDVLLLGDLPDPAGTASWAEAVPLPETSAATGLGETPAPGARFEPPGASLSSALVGAWTKSLAQHLHAEASLRLLRCAVLKATSLPGESEADFRGRLAHEARERRDEQVAKLRKKHAAKFDRLEERIRKAEQKVEVQRDQASHQRTSAMLSVGGAVLGALFGRRGSAVGKATSVAKGFGRVSQEKQDVLRAQADVEAARADLAQMEEEIAAEIQEIGDALDPASLELDDVVLPPRKSDLACSLAACWTPWIAGPDGLLRPGW